MAGIPYALQAAANSSGTDAPSRKLNPERAWSSVYISRRLRVRTSFDAARRRKSGKGRVVDRKETEGHLVIVDFAEMGRSDAAPLRGRNRFRDPTHLGARDLLATNRRSCATGPMLTPLHRASLANTLSPAARFAVLHAQAGLAALRVAPLPSRMCPAS